MAKKESGVLEVVYVEKGEEFPAHVVPLPLEKGAVVDIELSTGREVIAEIVKFAPPLSADGKPIPARLAKGLKLPRDLGHSKRDENIIPLVEIRGQYFKAAEINGQLIAAPDIQVIHFRNHQTKTSVRHKEHGAALNIPYWRFKDEK